MCTAGDAAALPSDLEMNAIMGLPNLKQFSSENYYFTVFLFQRWQLNRFVVVVVSMSSLLGPLRCGPPVGDSSPKTVQF